MTGKLGIPHCTTLRDTLLTCKNKLGGGAKREGVEVQIPLLIWRTNEFQFWYKSLKGAGNVLEKAK